MSNIFDDYFAWLDKPRVDLQRKLDRLPPQWRMSPTESMIQTKLCCDLACHFLMSLPPPDSEAEAKP